MVLEKFNMLMSKLDDPDDFEFVMEMLALANRYVSCVANMEFIRRYGGKIKEPREHREEITRLDASRSRTHDALISQVNAVNRLCECVGVEKIYTGGEDRREYGDFAMELVNAIFGERL